MMIAGGIDLGGTKIEAQIFDASWTIVHRHRVDTPKTYPELIAALVGLISWIESVAGPIPIGIAAAGLIRPLTGEILTANLPANGKPLPNDINAASGRHIHYMNDCRAMALSETVFGAARGFSPAVFLTIGTGIGGGITVNGNLLETAAGLGGEVGHFPLAAGPVAHHGLPIVNCGCGRVGCTETLLSGPGLARIVHHLTGQSLTAQQIVNLRKTQPDIAKCWDIWCELMAEMLMTLCLTIDPACIVLGGGLSAAPGLIDDVTAALQKTYWTGFSLPVIRLAEGGDTSGARGAGYAAFAAGGRA